MRTVVGTLAAFVLLSVGGVAAPIKSTTKITISSASAATPIEITDADVLAISSVYGGQFIGEPASEPDAALPRRTITFDIQTLDGIKVAAYVVHYVLDENTGLGYVYLPGRGEPSHPRNVSTILRVGQDGKWFAAAAEWNTAISQHLQ
jgi:hypothetical protein